MSFEILKLLKKNHKKYKQYLFFNIQQKQFLWSSFLFKYYYFVFIGFLLLFFCCLVLFFFSNISLAKWLNTKNSGSSPQCCSVPFSNFKYKNDTQNFNIIFFVRYWNDASHFLLCLSFIWNVQLTSLFF